MAALMVPGYRAVYEGWSRTVTDAFRYQWQLFDLQYRAGLKLLQALAPARSPAADELRELERRARDCVRRGVALPREIYDVRYRRGIDWSTFPEWARPVDPELFAGCGHEG
jgi:hypothetical protein